MQRVIVGTAGHIDHGKTRLLEAITGTNCDRWAEERERGITIDLGFAHLTREDLQIGFIDVPGHERFLHNALAGLGGIRIVLLVVAADEGIKPQTLEHLEICTLLGIPAALVAVTKSDTVSEDLLELAQLEIGELMAGSPWPDAKVMPVSSTTGTGIPELVETLVDIARGLPERAESGDRVRLPVDRAFQLKGLGSIVTGTLASGSIAIGDTLAVMPGSAVGKVRSIQVHGEERQQALAGERTAVQLVGISVGELERGNQLVTTGSFEPSASLLVEMELLPTSPISLSGSTPIRLHLYSSEVVGRLRPLDAEQTDRALEPGATGVAEIRLAAPIVAVRGDRFVVRRPSPQTTLGGGRILDPRWRRRRGARLARAVAGLSGSDKSSVEVWVGESGLDGLSADQLGSRLGRSDAQVLSLLQALGAEGRLVALEPGNERPTRWVRSSRLASLEKTAERLLTGYLDRERLATGMPKAEAIRRLMPGIAADVARVHLEHLETAGTLEVRGDLVTLPGRSAQLTSEETGLAARLERVYTDAALKPPSVRDAAMATGSKPQIVDGVIQYLIRQSRLQRLTGGLIISTAALDKLREELLASGLDDFTVAQFKELFGLSRKWAIPILEHLDAQRLTHRLGNIRKITRPREEHS
jgi:selenocysteine-specific elongation factor